MAKSILHSHKTKILIFFF